MYYRGIFVRILSSFYRFTLFYGKVVHECDPGKLLECFKHLGIFYWLIAIVCFGTLGPCVLANLRKCVRINNRTKAFWCNLLSVILHYFLKGFMILPLPLEIIENLTRILVYFILFLFFTFVFYFIACLKKETKVSPR